MLNKMTIIQLHLDHIPFAGRKGFRMLVAVAVGEIQEAVGEPGGLVVRRDIGQAHGDHGNGLVRFDFEFNPLD